MPNSVPIQSDKQDSGDSNGSADQAVITVKVKRLKYATAAGWLLAAILGGAEINKRTQAAVQSPDPQAINMLAESMLKATEKATELSLKRSANSLGEEGIAAVRELTETLRKVRENLDYFREVAEYEKAVDDEWKLRQLRKQKEGK